MKEMNNWIGPTWLSILHTIDLFGWFGFKQTCKSAENFDVIKSTESIQKVLTKEMSILNCRPIKRSE